MTDLVRGHLELGRERRWTYDAARRIHRINPVVLVTLAEDRALPGPVRNIDQRDFIQDVREELADARNYFVWQHFQLDRSAHLNLATVDGLRAEVRAGLADTAHLFERAERIRGLMNDWRYGLDLAA